MRLPRHHRFGPALRVCRAAPNHFRPGHRGWRARAVAQDCRRTPAPVWNFAGLMDGAEHDVLAHRAFPKAHWPQIHGCPATTSRKAGLWKKKAFSPEEAGENLIKMPPRATCLSIVVPPKDQFCRGRALADTGSDRSPTEAPRCRPGSGTNTVYPCVRCAMRAANLETARQPCKKFLSK